MCRGYLWNVPRRSRLALGGLVDVSGRLGGGLVLALESEEGDLVADRVLLGVEAELVQALGALEAARLLVVGVDDLVGGGNDYLGRGEVVALAAVETELEVKIKVEAEVEVQAEEAALLAVVVLSAEAQEGAGLGHGGQGNGGDGGGLHLGKILGCLVMRREEELLEGCLKM